MSIDTSGGLLEGIRLSEGNNGFTFPPRTVVSDQTSLDSVSGRAEYVLIAASTDPSAKSAEIVDPGLRFLWTKNQGTVVRFRYDSFSKRWLPSPGGPPDELGPLSNTERLIAPIPDSSVTDAPYLIYVGSTTRLVTFTVVLVGTEGDFTPPASLAQGKVELSVQDGKLNFSQADVTSYGGQTVLSQRQSFFDRIQSTGSIGSLPSSSAVEYFLFLNPKPASGHVPRVRIGYKPLLTAVQVPNEASLGTPSPGTFAWALDTGRVRISPADLDANAGLDLYYDGVTNGTAQLTRVALGSPAGSFPSSAFTIPAAIGVDDPQRFVIFAELAGQPRRYFNVLIRDPVNTAGSRPGTGSVYLDSSDGKVYMNPSDVSSLSGWAFYYLDSVVSIESGASVQFYRSGVNGSGPAQVPDFTIQYFVEDQVIVDGISASPFAMLPTTPLVDSDLSFSIAQAPGSSGTFTGGLLDGSDPFGQGRAYLLDLDLHQLNFAFRKTVQKTLLRPSPGVKLDDAAISELGFEVTKNGSPIVAGTDFSFDPDTGLMEFLDPVGESDPGNRSGISGTVALPDLFSSSPGTFSGSDVGKFLLFQSGSNQGIYGISELLSSSTVRVSPSFAAAGSAVADLRVDAEVVADRFWTEFRPPYKKFSLAVADSQAGPFTTLGNDQYSVASNVGQVSLAAPARPGQVFVITYVALDTEDDGFTYTPVNRVENALFKIRQEAAAVTVGSKVATFNPDGRTVNTARQLTLYLNGVPLDPEDFEFQAPGTINLAVAIESGQSLILDYWVEEALGGESVFDLLSANVDLDSPQISQGEQTTTFNGDQTDKLTPGSAMFIGQTEVVIVQSVQYDPSSDVTSVTFEQAPTVSSDGAAILATGSVSGSDYRVAETAPVDIFTQGTNFLFIGGDVSSSYRAGTIVTVDGDPLSVISAAYDASAGRTRVTFAASAKRNHVLPSLTRTIRPVLFPGSSFETRMPASAGSPFTLVRMGSNRKVLIRDVDYVLTEGGSVSLTEGLTFGDSLYALYVARTFQPAGTVFSINYAYAIAPGPNNGIQGQRLVATYNLYAPDTFFYRVETVGTFIPEVQDLLRSSASSGSSGPSIQDAVGQANKDYGRPSPYFDEQHLYNVDLVIRRLLLFYNDFVNGYEDLLSNLDGRIVGGNQGRFRFDGKIDNPPRTSFSEITNDIDDRIKLYDRLRNMASPNRLSRLFPTYVTQSAAISGDVGDDHRGDPIGSLDRDDIKSVQTVRSAKARAFFAATPGSSSFSIEKNGDDESLIPRFVSGQDVSVYSLDGVKQYTATVSSATTAEPATVVLNSPTSLSEGSLLQDVSDAGNSQNHFYTPGRDLVVDTDNGQIINNTFPAPLNAYQNPVVGSEILDFPLVLNNQDLRPRRIPVLDGFEQNDDGRLPEPLLKRTGESSLLAQEAAASLTLGFAKLSADLVTVSGSTVPIAINNKITFINGPNAGLERTVQSVASLTFTLSAPLLVADPVGSDFEVTSASVTYSEALAQEIPVLSTNSADGPTSTGAQLNVIDSELTAVGKVVILACDTISSGTGTAAPTTLTDLSANFTLAGVGSGYLIYVPSGANRGLYRVSAATANVLTVDTASPFQGFPVSGSTPYSVLRLLSFLDPAHAEFYAEFLRETVAFLSSTQSFLSALTAAGKAARAAAVAVRSAAVQGFLTQIEGLLTDDSIYEMRYLWIDQRTNRKEGTLAQQVQAAVRREDDLRKIVEDQRKLLIAEALIV